LWDGSRKGEVGNPDRAYERGGRGGQGRALGKKGSLTTNYIPLTKAG